MGSTFQTHQNGIPMTQMCAGRGSPRLDPCSSRVGILECWWDLVPTFLRQDWGTQLQVTQARFKPNSHQGLPFLPDGSRNSLLWRKSGSRG